jgi:hypothetical protein
VAKFSFRVSAVGVVTEVCAVGVPFAHRRTVGQHGLLRAHSHARSVARNTVLWRRNAIRERLFSQDARGIGFASQGGHSTSYAVDVKPLHVPQRLLARWRILPIEKINRVLRQPANLVRVRRQDEVISRQLAFLPVSRPLVCPTGLAANDII